MADARNIIEKTEKKIEKSLIPESELTFEKSSR